MIADLPNIVLMNLRDKNSKLATDELVLRIEHCLRLRSPKSYHLDKLVHGMASGLLLQKRIHHENNAFEHDHPVFLGQLLHVHCIFLVQALAM